MMKLGLCCGSGLCCVLLVAALLLGVGTPLLGEQVQKADDEAVSKAAALVQQSGQGDALKAVFNQQVDRVRLMVMLSPT